MQAQLVKQKVLSNYPLQMKERFGPKACLKAMMLLMQETQTGNNSMRYDFESYFNLCMMSICLLVIKISDSNSLWFN